MKIYDYAFKGRRIKAQKLWHPKVLHLVAIEKLIPLSFHFDCHEKKNHRNQSMFECFRKRRRENINDAVCYQNENVNFWNIKRNWEKKSRLNAFNWFN